ncbi:MAG: DNA gyrase subunit A [Blautia wexlerae]
MKHLVVMEQDFKKAMPLVDGHGNFWFHRGRRSGGDALYRSQSCRNLHRMSTLQIWIRMWSIFSQTLTRQKKSLSYFRFSIPNLLINGADGIAVGMTTSIPPHNLSEVVDAVKAYMDNPDISDRRADGISQGTGLSDRRSGSK